ncbi:MAG: hypothetical protein WAU01_17945 [Saprospiraceae bacterium]
MQKIINKYTVSLTILLFVIHLHGQRSVTTLSGQKLLYTEQNVWEVIPPAGAEVDKPYAENEKPEGTPTSDLDQMQVAYHRILAAAELREFDFFVKMDNFQKQISAKESQLSQAKMQKNKSKVKAITRSIDHLKKETSEVEQLYRASSNKVLMVKNLVNTKTIDRIKGLKVFGKEFKVDIPDISENKEPLTTVAKPSVAPKTATSDCKLLRDNVVRKERIMETQPEILFVYTPDRLKSYFKEKDLMEVKGSILQKSKNQFLHITVKIFSKDAAKNYGFIQRDAMLKISTISGKSVILYNLNDVRGKIEDYTGHMVYDAIYPLTGDEAQLLGRVPMDTVGMMWSSGFESYDIYHVDVLMNHFTCLKKI